jgi:predicted alpha/beta hydrolase family esterase
MAAQLALLRAAFRVGERVAPAAAARQAARLWFTVPGRRPPDDGIEVPEAEEFVIPGADGPVPGRSWGSGPAVHFMHGWGGHGGQVHALVGPLVERGLRVVTFDGPGHGPTAGRTRRRTHAVEFARALTVVGRHHGPAAVVVAHSLGALAVLAALESGELAPPAALVLVAPLTEVTDQLDRLAGTLGLGPRTRRRLDAEVPATTGRTVAELALDRLARSYPGEQVLVVHDRADTFAPHHRTVSLVRAWPGARLLSTDGLGHLRVLTDPAVVAAVRDAAVDAAAGRRPHAIADRSG